MRSQMKLKASAVLTAPGFSIFTTGPVDVTNDLSGVILPGCPPGEPTAVEFRSVDACGNETVAGSSIVVIDTTPPDLVVPGSNHRFGGSVAP